MHRYLLIALLSIATPGCAGYLGHRFITPAHAPSTLAAANRSLAELDSHYQFFETAAGVRLAYYVLEAGDYRLDYRYLDQGGRFSYRLYWKRPRLYPGEPRGTVILLHGWGLDSKMLRHWAIFLAQQNFQSILVDLRNHGFSSAAAPGYGTRESRDVVELVAELRRRRQIVGPLSLFGVSYGAATAILAGAELPDLRALVAMEPFANAADAIRGGFDRLAPAEIRWLVGSATLERAIDSASDQLGIDLRHIDLLPVAQNSIVCTLLIHGINDDLIPVASSELLALAARNAQLYLLPDDGHFSTPARLDLLGGPVAFWLAETGRIGTPCPRFRPQTPTRLPRSSLGLPGPSLRK